MKRPVVWIGFCLLLVVALCMGCDRPSPARPAPEAGMPVLIFERQGGIAGFQDKLVVGYGGEYYLSRGATGDRIGMLPSDRRMELQGWLDRLAPFTWKSEDNPGGPDSMVQVLVWAGLGTANADDAQQQELLDWAANLLQELSAAGS